MTLYSQLDQRWRSLPLGNSGCRCGGYGCTVCTVAQALTLAGWNITPADLINALNLNGGFDDNGYLKWYWVGKAYPQFRFQTSASKGLYKFCQGTVGQYTHWVLMKDGVYYDPLRGSNDLSLSGVQNLQALWSADIDVNPNPVAVLVSAPPPPAAAGTVFEVRIDSPLGRNVHIGAADVSAPISAARFLNTGDTFEALSVISSSDPYPGTFLSCNKWYITDQSVIDRARDSSIPLRYVWAGETTIISNKQA